MGKISLITDAWIQTNDFMTPYNHQTRTHLDSFTVFKHLFIHLLTPTLVG